MVSKMICQIGSRSSRASPRKSNSTVDGPASPGLLAGHEIQTSGEKK